MSNINDYMIRAVAENGGVRAFAAITTQTVNKAFKIHHTSPVATAALGRLLTAAAMMGASLKGEKDSISLQLTGGGPLGKVLAISDCNSNVRGYVINPQVDMPLNPDTGKLDVGGAVGKEGSLTVITDLGLKEPYVGTVPLVSGEGGDDITSYFATSQQTPSAVGLGVLVDRDYTVKCSGGFIVQVMPDAADEDVQKLENNVAKITSVTNLLKDGKSAEDILKIALDGIDFHITETRDIAYKCNCTRKRVERALVSLGKKELTDIINTDGKAELTCQFCDAVYNFTKDELEELIKND